MAGVDIKPFSGFKKEEVDILAPREAVGGDQIDPVTGLHSPSRTPGRDAI